MTRKQTDYSRNYPSPPFEELNRLARKYSRREEEADDLVQDLLVEAVHRERDFTADGFMPWAHGFLRNRAAFVARTEGRRRKREKAVREKRTDTVLRRTQFPETFVETLPPSLRNTARLINCGLNRNEIAYLLDVKDAALRQRFTALRRKWQAYLDTGGSGPEFRDESTSPFDNGLLRRSLRNSFHGSPYKAIGSFDPDGHLFVIRTNSPHKKDTGGNNRTEQEP